MPIGLKNKGVNVLKNKTNSPHVAKMNKYVKDILSGKIGSCLYVRQACQRHVDDLKLSKKAQYIYKFDKLAAEKICRFAEMLPHVKGEWSGSNLTLEPWQCFMLCCVFGWVRKSDNLRRFKEMYAEIPRKNGKSIIGAIVGSYMFAVDNEPGAEVYSGATSLAQAHEIFRPAWLMTKKTGGYQNKFKIELGGTERNPGNLYSLLTGSRFEAVVGKPGDGASVHCGLVDEYHEHSDDTLYDCFITGMGARTQPLMAVLTTAGTDTSYPCYAKRNQIIDILAGKKDNKDIFGIIYSIDKDDDWTSYDVWRNANPNLGVSIMEDFLKRQHRTAIQETRKQNILKCKHLNMWSNAGSTWLNAVDWEKCYDRNMNINDFKGEPCYIGLDLASKKDLASKMLLFKKDGEYYLFSTHYTPEENTYGEDKSAYAGWAHDKYLTLHPGARIDIEAIQEDIVKDAQRFDIAGEDNNGGEVCSDPWNAQQLLTNLVNQGIACVEIPQTAPSLTEPMKELEVLIIEGKFHHDGNPVTTWMFQNVFCEPDHKENIFPRKSHKTSPNKIDGAVATINAMARAMYFKEAQKIIPPSFM